MPPRTRLAFWIAVLLLCFSGGGLRLWQNLQYRRAHEAWVQQTQRWEHAASLAFERMRSQSRDLFGPPLRNWTQTDLEQHLNGGRPFEAAPAGEEPGTKRAVWVDAATGVAFTFEFRDGRLTGSTGPWSDRRMPPQPARSSLDQLTERIRRAFAGSFNLGVGTGAWLLALTLFALLRRQRQMMGEILLALSLLCGTAWLVDPAYSLSLKGLGSNDMLFWAVVMLLVSIGGLIFVQFTLSPSDEPLCPICEYNLRGNVSGICPECGTPILKSDAEAAASESAKGTA